MKILTHIVSIVFMILLGSCTKRVTPWDIRVPGEYTNLTAKHLERLQNSPNQQLPFTFAVLADPQGTPKDLNKVVEAINREPDVSFTLVLGDMTDYGLLHEYVWAAEALERLVAPYLTVVGNHDAIAHGKSIYQDMFGPFQYTFSYGPIKFVMFNSNLYEFGETNFGWLTQEAVRDSIIASHVPPVEDMHNRQQIDEWTSINRDAGVLLSLHGHRGTIKSFYWVEKNIPYYVVARARHAHYALVTVNEDRSVRILPCYRSCQRSP